MTETPAQRELARIVARLDREAKRPVDVALVRCAQHGPQYACPDAVATPELERVVRDHLDDDGLTWSEIRAVPTGRWHARCGHIACSQIAAGRCPECETP